MIFLIDQPRRMRMCARLAVREAAIRYSRQLLYDYVPEKAFGWANEW